MVFVDSDVLIDILRQVPLAIAVLELAKLQGQLTVSVVVRMEIIIGSLNKEAQQRTESLLARMRTEPLNEAISEITDALVTRFYLSNGLKIADALIAAICIAHDSPLLTKNQRDFKFIPGLKLLPYPPAIT